MFDPSLGPTVTAPPITVTVTSWGTPEGEVPGQQWHDCLWQIAYEQAVFARMNTQHEDYATAQQNVTEQEIMTQLDKVCDDNNFKRLDGSGPGQNNPNLIDDGSSIVVGVDPNSIYNRPAVIKDGTTSQQAYDLAVAGPGGPAAGPDPLKKQQLDSFIASIPRWNTMPPEEQTSWIQAARNSANHQDLIALANSARLTVEQQKTVLAMYGSPDKKYTLQEINHLLRLDLNKPENEARLRLIFTPGFQALDAGKQKRLLERYDQDEKFRAAIDTIIQQDNFTHWQKQKGTVLAKAQAHALDILYRYAGRKAEGYGGRPQAARTMILVDLYNTQLASDRFKLNETTGKPGDLYETYNQERYLDTFAEVLAGLYDMKVKD